MQAHADRYKQSSKFRLNQREHSTSRNCDYATRYPEAVPLKSIDAESVTEELIKVFARVGVPREIVTDQGANFTSRNYLLNSTSSYRCTLYAQVPRPTVCLNALTRR